MKLQIFINILISFLYIRESIAEEFKRVELHINDVRNTDKTKADVMIGESLLISPVLAPDYLAQIDHNKTNLLYYIEKNSKLIGNATNVKQFSDLYPSFYLRNCTPFDSGQYSFILEKKNNLKDVTTITIGVKSKPIMRFINLEPLNLNELRNNWTATAEIYSYPKCELSWFFTPCEHLNIHRSQICNEMYKYKIDKFSISTNSSMNFLNTTILFQPKATGMLTCNCINELGDIKITEDIILEKYIDLGKNTTLVSVKLGFLLTEPESDFINVKITEKTENILLNITARNFVTINPVVENDYRKYLLNNYNNISYYWMKDMKILPNVSYSENLKALWPPFYPKSDIFDSGDYLFVLNNTEKNFKKIVNVTIAVESKPLMKFIKLEPLYMNQINKNWTATAEVYSYPQVKISWHFTPCDNLYLGRLPKCSETDKYEIKLIELQYNSTLYFVNITINFQPEQSGILTCNGINQLGNETISKFILFNDETELSDRINIKTIPDGGVTYLEESISLICTCLSFYNHQELYSVAQNSIIKSDLDHEISIKTNELDKIITVKMSDVKLIDNGLYECRCYKDLKNVIYDKASIKLNVIEKVKSFWSTDFIFIIIGMILLLITLFGAYIFYMRYIKEKAWTLLYDAKYEFPVNRIKIESELGCGAFGVVFEAIAEGILPNEPETIVAVKTIKKSSANESTLRALESELEILLSLGNHLNIINLLGTVTKSNQRYRLMVIVEFCKFGNLKSFIFENKISFINDMNLTNGIINNTYNEIMFSTNTLIYWSYQIAKGMEYVSLLNILHGDLAARNILLCDFNIVKICDFGLAKSINYQYNYQTKDDTPLPIRWLAIETLECGILSIYSDVWSFGVLTWELFSLCSDPYRKFPLDRYFFFQKLTSGYRLEIPKFANNEIYQLMLECWKEQPKERPSFTYLVERFKNILAENALNAYINHTKLFEEKNQFRNPDNLESNPKPPIQHLGSQGLELLPSVDTKKYNKKSYKF